MFQSCGQINDRSQTSPSRTYKKYRRRFVCQSYLSYKLVRLGAEENVVQNSKEYDFISQTHIVVFCFVIFRIAE